MTLNTTLIRQLRAILRLTQTEAQIARLRTAQARTNAVRRELTTHRISIALLATRTGAAYRAEVGNDRQTDKNNDRKVKYVACIDSRDGVVRCDGSDGQRRGQ